MTDAAGKQKRRYWTEEEIAIITADRAAGVPVPDTAKRLGRPITSVENKLADIRHVVPRPRVPSLVELSEVLPLPNLDDLRPVVLDAPSPRRQAASANADVTLIAGDFHFPQQDDGAIAIFLELVRQLRPKRVILNGDTVDMLAVSKYPKDARAAHNWVLRDEALAFHAFLHALEGVLCKDAELIETEANHSGNGVASRWWRYLSDRVPHLLSLPGAEEKLSYQNWWYPKHTRVTLQEQVVIAGSLLVTHGDIVRKWAGYSAKAHSEKYLHSVLHSHTHRMGSGIQRVPAVGGREESVIRSYEIGCMCRLDPGYASMPNWAQGCAIVVSHGDEYGVELVNITRGRAAVAALGKVVAA